MDVTRILKCVKTLDDYLKITQDLKHKYKTTRFVYNISPVVHLKNIQSLEIDYFNKYDDNGAAFIIFEHMLEMSPGRSWVVLGKELVTLIQYWLDGLRKRVINHHPHWWTFLKQLLDFIKELKQKDNTLSNILVEELTGSLLDLATNRRSNVKQKHEILYTLNMLCAESAREIRLQLLPQFQHYFIRLSLIIASCGYFPAQNCILETLIRWLLPRHDVHVRQEAAGKWFPPHVYDRAVVNVFLQRSWNNFLQDARDFLNAYNKTNNEITSVLCKKLTIGELVVISGNERHGSWLDLNAASGCMTVILNPSLLHVLGAPGRMACEALVITGESVLKATLYRESANVLLSVTTAEPPLVLPSMSNVFGDGRHHVNISISSRSSLPRVDIVLRELFQHKYQVQMELDEVLPSSLDLSGFVSNTDEDTRFSRTVVDVKTRKQIGCTEPQGKSVKSTSTTSTTSLAQLQDKLAALPHHLPPKALGSVCMKPELSRVIETNEDDTASYNPSIGSGTLNRTPGAKLFGATPKQSHTEGEVVTGVEQNIGLREAKDKRNNAPAKKPIKHKFDISRKTNVNNRLSQSDTDVSKDAAPCIAVYSTGDDDSSNSLLHEGADNSTISAALTRLPKEKAIATEYIIDLLINEASEAQAKKHDRALDSGINTGEGKITQYVQSSEVIENTACIEPDKTILSVKTKQDLIESVEKVRKSSSTEEFNTDSINEAPISNVNVRARNVQRKGSNEKKVEIAPSDVQTVDFFSQHCLENKCSNPFISPTLARKVNNSESSEDLDFCIEHIESEYLDLEIVECLNSIVDQVCINSEKYTKYLDQEDTGITMMVIDQNITTKSDVHNKSPGKKQMREKKKIVTQNETLKRTKSKTQQNIKLNSGPKAQCTSKSRVTTKNKLKLELATKLSTIPKASNENKDLFISIDKQNNPKIKDIHFGENETKNLETPVIRRKRKLYSRKSDIMPENSMDDEIIRKKYTLSSNPGNDDIPLAELKRNMKSASPEVLKDCTIFRNNLKRKPNLNIYISPCLKNKNDVFNNLRNNVESVEKITLADVKSSTDIGVFNFSSDSEDEDFKKRKREIQKRISTTTLDNGNSILSTCRGRTVTDVNCIKKNTEDSATKTKMKIPLRKGPVKRQKLKAKKKEVELDPVIEYEYEKMRDQQEVLNTSLSVVKNSKSTSNNELEPAIVAPTLEVIVVENIQNKSNSLVTNEKKANKTTERRPATKRSKPEAVPKIVLDMPKEKEDDGTMSPLPGLVVETAVMVEQNDSLTSNMIKKFNQIYQEGPDTSINITTTTQNLLSDDEKADFSVKMNIIDEFDGVLAKDKSTDYCARETHTSENKSPKTTAIKGNKNTYENKLTDIYKKKSLQLKNKKEHSQYVKEISQKDVTRSMLETKNKPIGLKRNEKVLQNVRNDISKQKIKEISSTYKYKETQLKSNKSTDRNNSQTKIHNTNNNTDFSKIYDLTDVESEHSMSTVGITGHKNSNESPPNLKTLIRQDNVIPRNLEDMDESSKNYYIKLISEAECHNLISSNFTGEPKELSPSKSGNREKVTTPVVYVEKLSPEVLSLYSKERCKGYREKHNNESVGSPEEQTVNKRQNENVKKHSPDKVSTCSNNSRKYNYIQCLPFPNSSNTEESPGSNKRVNIIKEFSPTVSLTRMPFEAIVKLLHLPNSGSISESLKKSIESTPTPGMSNIDDKKREEERNSLEFPKKRKSMISPILPFKTPANRSQDACVEVSYNDNIKNTRTRDRENIFYSLRRNPKTRKVVESVKNTPIERIRNSRYFLRSTSDLTMESSLECENPIEGNIAFDSDDDEALINTAKKRKSSVTYDRPANKKAKQGISGHIETVTRIESEPTISSSVNDWIEKNRSEARAGAFPTVFKDMILNLHERLDVTLNEIQTETSESLIHTFVEIRKTLVEIKEDFNTKVDSVVHNMASVASKVIRKDSQKKRAMVKLMQEDLQAVLEHLERLN